MARDRDRLLLNPLRVGAQLLPDLRQTVPGRMALDEAAIEHPFKGDQPPLHCGLVHTQRFRGGKRAAMTRHCEQVAQIVPVKHSDVMHSCRLPAQDCGSRRADRSGKFGRMNASARARLNWSLARPPARHWSCLAIALQQRMLEKHSLEVEPVSAPGATAPRLPLTRQSDSSASPRPSCRSSRAIETTRKPRQ